MSFRVRLFLAFLGAVLVPIGVLAYGVRRTLDDRAVAAHGDHVAALEAGLRRDLDTEAASVARRVRAIAQELAGETRFRLEALERPSDDRRWLLDYGASAMQQAGLAMLQVQDSGGRILTSGHFRNEYDRVDERPLRALAAAELAILESRTPERAMNVLARLDSFTVGGRRFYIVGGTGIDSAFVSRLARDPAFSVALADGNEAGSAGIAVSRIGRDGRLSEARFVLRQESDLLSVVRRGIDRWTLTALLATLGVGVLLATWLATRVSRPIRALAEQTAAIDLDRLDLEFSSERSDELGTLSRVLTEMTGRLRRSAAALREAERRAAMGDMSRQVTHDIKNGIAPIRHVFRHLEQVARDRPGELPMVFADRRATIESSVAYLETLARNYARLAPDGAAAACDVNAVLRELARDLPTESWVLRTDLADGLPPVAGDALTVRRIAQNLAGNAVDSLVDGQGTVTLETRRTARGVLLTVADTGRGMSKEQLDHAFDDFHTTKPGGTGLGLSVVRRLTADLGGTLRVETEPGAGTRFFVELPQVRT